jgi:prevent-host-death family protein
LAPSSGYDHAHYDITCRSKKFGLLIDIVQQQPVSVTRRGRPVAVIQSYEDYQASQLTIPAHVAKWICQNAPLRGSSAGDVMREHFPK